MEYIALAELSLLLVMISFSEDCVDYNFEYKSILGTISEY